MRCLFSRVIDCTRVPGGGVPSAVVVFTEEAGVGGGEGGEEGFFLPTRTRCDEVEPSGCSCEQHLEPRTVVGQFSKHLAGDWSVFTE